MWLILQGTTRKKALRVRAGSLDSAVTRSQLELLYPGKQVLDQFERAPTPPEIVQVYLSRTRDGLSRCCTFEQWAICDPPEASA